ncbi:MAG: hypothetical protein PF569_08565 [Candidatus Woesearchaeota archaeon]|jgi:hypothetical protein|nr:hypothetical protein [Candidatus Woesearchaeota archaeon]
MSNLPLGAEFDSSAPWNEKEEYCSTCGSNKLKIDDTGIFKNIKWINYKCIKCGLIINNEPNYD